MPAKGGWRLGDTLSTEHRAAVSAAQREIHYRKREALVTPWVDVLERMVCGDDEEFDDAGRQAAIDFLMAFSYEIRPVRQP